MTAGKSELPPSIRSAGADDRPIRVGISACLLGQEVRYDGGHKRDSFLVDTFGRFVEWVPVCPEVEAGFGTPREAMRLVGGARWRPVDDGEERAGCDRATRRRRCTANANTSGGAVERLHTEEGFPQLRPDARQGLRPEGYLVDTGSGLFAAALTEAFPYLPIEEEGRLSDPRLRENFVERVFGYWRLRGLFTTGWTVASLMRFHSAHKLILMAHSSVGATSLGRIAAQARSSGRPLLSINTRKGS